jgi:uncharacterized protein YecT (DUF1311 family)
MAPGLSQAELNECYGNAYKKADAELNVLYRQITARLKDDKAITTLLVAAQRAWVAFRDAECDFSVSGISGGSAYGMILAICLDKLTGKRIDDVRKVRSIVRSLRNSPLALRWQTAPHSPPPDSSPVSVLYRAADASALALPDAPQSAIA